MRPTDPLLLRCLTLTGSFETGYLPPRCWSVLTGDFDNQGLSYSVCQWNFGQSTLQPLLLQMYAENAPAMLHAFGGLYEVLRMVLHQPKPSQMAWARSIQDQTFKVAAAWSAAFSSLGYTTEWQAIAQASAAHYMEQAKVFSTVFGISSDRAMALLFDCCVQNGGISNAAEERALDSYHPSWGEAEKMRAIAEAVAASAIPKWQKDVLQRKLAIANGGGIVHGVSYDLAAQFCL